jgi:ABC-2 type transport system permease protein
MSAVSALIRKSHWHFVNVEKILRQQSLFKVIFIVCFAMGFEVGLWMLFLDGFRFLDALGGAGAMIAIRLFSLFFLGMGFMLVLSGVVTSYATIFRSPEIAFMMTRPFEIRQIVLYKFVETAGLSSWAFFFVIIPFVGSYAWYRHISILFMLWTLLFSIPFLALCSGIGTILTILVVRWFPNRRILRMALATLILCALVFFWWFSRGLYKPEDDMQFNLARLVPGLSVASNALFPSWWISEGIMALSRSQWLRGIMLWLMVSSTAVMMGMVLEWLGNRIFYDGWQRTVGSSGWESHAPILLPRLDKWLSALLPADVRALVLKDLRTFFRDPMQWSQVLIFFGLLALYYANLRSFHYHLLPDTWRNTVAFLNVFSVAAVMCSLGSRFIYPQLSLEGQGFWIIGLSPTSMRTVLLTKFLLSLLGMLTVSVSLMLLSSSMLKASLLTQLVATALAGSISCAVCGLSTGLGAVFLNLEQRNPSAIVSGFGGTLNLVFSLGFMLAVILPFGFIFHLHNTAKISQRHLPTYLEAATAWMCLLTIGATLIPLWIGARHLKKREF